MSQKTFDDKVRLSPRVSRDVARLAKSKAVVQAVTLEYVIEQLLRGYVNGKFKITETAKEQPRYRVS